MSQLTWTFIVIIAAAAIYFYVVRPRLKARPELADYYRRLEARELDLWQRLRARMRGLKTYLVLFVGIIVSAQPEIVSQIDLAAWGIPQEWVGRITQMSLLLGILTRAAGQASAKGEG